jgi:hypothetical protein
MGELAFTRDTGRLFVGNYSTQDLELDIKTIGGGILTGNKYIGLIDSRPLCHFNGNGSTGCYPLNYETNTEDRVENKVFPDEIPDEIGLFLANSRYRPFKENTQSFKYGGDGWNKKPEYIQKYGVYSGDYTFDIYNNALILFDKNIKLNTGEQTVSGNLKEIKINTGTLTWDGSKEYIIDSQDNNITNESYIRTPITNIKDPNENISQYPIYGDGYVIMRILEPDGITIDYADKKFQDGEPVTTSEKNNIGSYPNWTHNILTVKYPLDKILENFDKNNFYRGTNGISLGSYQDNDESLTITLPNKFEITDSGWERFTDEEGNAQDKRITFRPLKYYNNTDMREENPFEDITEDSPIDKRACFLTISKEGQIQYKSPKSVATQTDVDNLKKEFGNKKHVIKIGNGLSLFDSNAGESASEINLFNEDTVWELSLKSSESQTMDSSTGFNPWELDHKGTYIYSGSCGFSNGILVTTESYEDDYQYTKNTEGKKVERGDFKEIITDKYENNKLTNLNYRKTPYTLHENGSGKVQYINMPYIAAINNEFNSETNGTISCPSYSPQPVIENIQEFEENKIDETTGETVTITKRIYQDVHDAYGIKAASQNTDTTNRVPKNANSVILQVTHDDELTMKTGNDFSSLDVTILQTTGAGCDVVELPLYPGVEIYSEVTTKVTVQKNDEEEINQSTEGYSSKSITTKSFMYDVTSSSNFTIKLLGYRV